MKNKNRTNPKAVEKELRETKKKLRESEEKNHLLSQSITAGYILCTAIYDKAGSPFDYQIIEINRSFEKITGNKANNIQGKTILEVFKETGERLIQECGKKVMANTPANVEYLSKRLGKWLNVTAHPLGAFQVVTLVRDVTDQKQTELECRRINRVESIEKSLGGIAHDFNNQLQVILGYASLALEFTENEHQKHSLKTIENSAKVLKSETKRLIDSLKEQPCSLEIISPRKIVGDELKFIPGISSEFKYDNNLPTSLWKIKVDCKQIENVILNLQLNAYAAMKASGGGTLCIQGNNLELTNANNCYDLPPGKYVHLSFRDEGHGIPEKFLDKIFERGFSTKTNSKKESGLGLYNSRRIIEWHGGKMTVESEQGNGATFHIYLPAMESSAEEEISEKHMAQALQLKILILDDEPSIRELLQDMLANMHHITETSRYGTEAIDKYREAFESRSAYDLVILDLTIPGGIGGKVVFKELQLINPSIRAIISSGSLEMVECRGVINLQKPYGFKDLEEAIFRAMS